MNRAKQRENHRLKYRGHENPRQESRTSSDKPWLNSEGYRDPTAFAAIRNIERAERKAAVNC